MKILYQCEICQEVYADKAEAEACEAQGVGEPLFEVGDFVVTETTWGRFGWFDGDPAWVIEREEGLHGHIEGRKAYSLIYVVTAITVGEPRRPEHELCYHLCTKGMTAKSGYDDGFNFPHTHLRYMCKIKVDLDVGDLVGRIANFLV